MTLRLFAAALLACAAELAQAQPANDNFANAEVVTSLPFTDTELGIGSATVQPTDPLLLCYVDIAPSTGQHTVWYRYTTGAATEYVTLTTNGSSYDTELSVYTGTPGQLQLVSGACSDDSDGPQPAQLQSRNVGVRFKPNTTYYIEVAAWTVINPATLILSIVPAAQYHVTTIADTNDGNCDAHCSLREAITAANATPGAILVPAGGYVITRIGSNENANATGDFDIRAPMAIYGAGAGVTVVDASQVDRVFDIRNSATLRVDALLADMTISGGELFFGESGGGIFAPTINVFLSLDRVVIRDNRTTGDGGGLHTAMRMLMRESTVFNNLANAGGAGLSLVGDFGMTALIERSTLVNNNSTAFSDLGGGGIRASNRLRIDNSTISRNFANFAGGGIDLVGGSLELHSTTVADNFALGGLGGGGGLRLGGPGDIVIANSIIAGNSSNDPILSHNCLKTGTGNLDTSYSLLHFLGGGCVFDGEGDITGLLSDLEPIADNGGPTQTQAMNQASPGRNAGNPAGCFDHLGRTLVTDQRGGTYVRTHDGRCDMGAFEVQPLPATVPGIPDLVAASDSGFSNVDNVTNDATPTFTGSCGTGDTIEILSGATVLTPAQACAGDAYDITVDLPLSDGPHTITARATRGTVAVSTSALMMVVDTIALPPTFTSPSSGPEVPIFSGNSAEANAQVTVLTEFTVVCIGTADLTGNWACTSTMPMPVGTTNLFVIQLDRAFNESQWSPPFGYTVIDAVFANGFE